MAEPLHLAVCLFPGVTALDYQGPIELLRYLNPKNLSGGGSRAFPHPLPYSIEPTYLSHSLDPVKPSSGPLLLPDATYDTPGPTNQYDIIMVPGGPVRVIQNAPDTIIRFLEKQSPGAKYILGICTGSLFLAKAGILNGKNATTNKASFIQVMADTKDLPITWVRKARWVVDDDNRLWTSSGVTAGQDMAIAFLKYLIGVPNTEIIRNWVELIATGEGEDEFAEHYGLLEDEDKTI